MPLQTDLSKLIRKVSLGKHLFETYQNWIVKICLFTAKTGLELFLICLTLINQARSQVIFWAEEVSCKRGISIKVSCTTYKKRASQKKMLVFSSMALLRLHFKWEFKPIDAHKLGTFFHFQNRAWETFPLPPPS